MNQYKNKLDELLEELNRLFIEYRMLDFPRISSLAGSNELIKLISDVQVDLADEDGYIAGLVDTYLSKRQIWVKEIRIDTTIDSRLTHVLKISEDDSATIQKFITYRQKMLELATILSRTCNLPILKWKRNDVKADKTGEGSQLLNINQKELFREVIVRHKPTLLPLLDSLGHELLTTKQREELREILAAELCESGLDEHDEPNQRGLLLEELIDCLGQF